MCTIPPLSDIMQNEWAAAGENYETFWQPLGGDFMQLSQAGTGFLQNGWAVGGGRMGSQRGIFGGAGLSWSGT